MTAAEISGPAPAAGPDEGPARGGSAAAPAGPPLCVDRAVCEVPGCGKVAEYSADVISVATALCGRHATLATEHGGARNLRRIGAGSVEISGPAPAAGSDEGPGRGGSAAAPAGPVHVVDPIEIVKAWVGRAAIHVLEQGETGR